MTITAITNKIVFGFIIIIIIIFNKEKKGKVEREKREECQGVTQSIRLKN